MVQVNTIIIIVVSALLGFLIFLALRSFVLWYFKINELVSINKSIENHLREINGKTALSTGKNSNLTAEQKAKLYEDRNK